MAVKNVVILGSTGSIGVNTLKVIEHLGSEFFRVIGLTAFSNHELLTEQIKAFRPTHVATNASGRDYLIKSGVSKETVLFDIETESEILAGLDEADIIVIATPGSAALKPFLRAVRCGKRVAPANKEALVIAGDILMDEARRCGATIVPVDSEQSAIFQCLQGQNTTELKSVHLTASGGALREVESKDFSRLTVEDILRHPRWKMGDKITVDSATLMNKGFEVIEAQRLFGLAVDQIKVIVHPEAIIHSMIEMVDGSFLAQLSITDMRLPIQYALTYPERKPAALEPLNLTEWERLTFYAPDRVKFPALQLAFDVAKEGGTLPAVLNAADEVAVEAFLNKTIGFTEIFPLIEGIIGLHDNRSNPTLDDIFEADRWARQQSLARMR